MPIVSTSTSAFYETARRNIADLRSQAEALQGQLGSGAKLARSSDDPVAASRLRNLARLEKLANIDTTNADRATADLTLTDAAMSNMADTIIRAQELAMRASSTTLNAEQLSALGQELEQIHNNLLGLANSRDSNGHALFGGESTGDAYQLDAGGNAVYIGTASTTDLPLGEGQSVTRAMTGPQVLQFTDAGGNQTDVMATVKALAEALKGASADPAGAARDALASLQTGLDTLTTAQTVVGTRLAWIELTGERRTDLQELRTVEEANLGATDIASTIATLQETLTVLEASQASFAKLAGLTLFDHIR